MFTTCQRPFICLLHIFYIYSIFLFVPMLDILHIRMLNSHWGQLLYSAYTYDIWNDAIYSVNISLGVRATTEHYMCLQFIGMKHANDMNTTFNLSHAAQIVYSYQDCSIYILALILLLYTKRSGLTFKKILSTICCFSIWRVSAIQFRLYKKREMDIIHW